ncbi:hypothetical protein F3K02_09180 [Hydrogenophaga sp. D2P1]|uniref:Uncharacterized protein n=1 Tax=Hydrogenophaga aromaticivorans TaxID=2610898 RepID=A0A7Y8KXU8_9BURK|nr:hypothetical protein [Hydrogenophaga aromaticivorans]NWF45418.1 hypothetical protein [Hydrogenophaga aromaticivorans]
MNNTQRISEGPASAARLIGAARWEAHECGHGTCAAAVDCIGECELKAAVLNLPVIDAKFLDSQLKCDMPIEMIEPVKSVISGAERLKTAALVIAAMLALACTFYVSSI